MPQDPARNETNPLPIVEEQTAYEARTGHAGGGRMNAAGHRDGHRPHAGIREQNLELSLARTWALAQSAIVTLNAHRRNAERTSLAKDFAKNTAGPKAWTALTPGKQQLE
ncbi:hypothetical protein [Methylobacterium sp. 77]|uniref:hypothetical protein n=1 Tax=Methylobacterium sp. 77 TaxID=1101192 RepID=UPI0012DE2E80|nr:hypothetical protein [Methylobacterium sp. 77]